MTSVRQKQKKTQNETDKGHAGRKRQKKTVNETDTKGISVRQIQKKKKRQRVGQPERQRQSASQADRQTGSHKKTKTESVADSDKSPDDPERSAPTTTEQAGELACLLVVPTLATKPGQSDSGWDKQPYSMPAQ